MNAFALRLAGSVCVLFSGVTMAEIRTEEVTYAGDGIEMNGYLAWDDSRQDDRPGVLVVHEWWGQNEYPRRRARMLAELGYTALAIDMYGDGKVGNHPDDAGAFMNEVVSNLEGARARFDAGLEVLKNHPSVDGSRIGAIGYCFGGGVVLHMARYGADLDVVASFHGSLGLGVAAEGEGSDVKARVVAYNGEDDPFVPQQQIDAFKAEMESTGANYQFINLPGVIHGFTNPEATANGEKFGLPLRYDALADEASWAHMQLVFNKAFGGKE